MAQPTAPLGIFGAGDENSSLTRDIAAVAYCLVSLLPLHDWPERMTGA